MACSAPSAENERDDLMLRQRPFLVEALTAVGLDRRTFILPPSDSRRPVNRSLDLRTVQHRLRYTVRLSPACSASASRPFPAPAAWSPPICSRVVELSLRGAGSYSSACSSTAVVGFLVGLIALAAHGIYCAEDATVAIAEVLLFRRIQSPLDSGRRERPARRADAQP